MSDCVSKTGDCWLPGRENRNLPVCEGDDHHHLGAATAPRIGADAATQGLDDGPHEGETDLLAGRLLAGDRENVVAWQLAACDEELLELHQVREQGFALRRTLEPRRDTVE